MNVFRHAALSLGLVTLDALGLSATPAAAQTELTLQSGDVVTVSGAGTVGTIGGIPVANSTNTYSVGDAPPGYDIGTFGSAAFTLAAGGILGPTTSGLEAFGSGPVTVAGGTINGGNGGCGFFPSVRVVSLLVEARSTLPTCCTAVSAQST